MIPMGGRGHGVGLSHRVWLSLRRFDGLDENVATKYAVAASGRSLVVLDAGPPQEHCEEGRTP